MKCFSMNMLSQLSTVLFPTDVQCVLTLCSFVPMVLGKTCLPFRAVWHVIMYPYIYIGNILFLLELSVCPSSCPSDSHKLYQLHNNLIYLNHFEIACNKCLPLWDNVQSACYNQLGSRSKHCITITVNW